ncbi:Aminomethyltransferase [Dermatophilus congolensis]|uniref:Aminomethyltransferase n=1 Tax=Dermatophilus congolensis TaxID=1863 RepID=A0AA46BLF4_9MICO|nr:folate-binding protein YgfZ [Dermatophilus congolensis]STD04325.1 Aminomethyltransferase [Dermatophilus congolensis]
MRGEVPPASPLLARPKAVAGVGVDAGIAVHYGDPLRESRLLEQGVAVADLSNRGVVTVSGPDRLSWLNSLTTQSLLGLAPRHSMSTLVLDPQGRIEHDLHVVDDGQTLWMTVEPGTSGAVVAWLDSMRFMLRVEVADVSDRFAVVGEPVARESVEGELLAWVDAWPGPVGDTACYGPDAPVSRPVRGRAALQRRLASGDAAGQVVPEEGGQVVPGFEHPGRERAWREVIVPREGVEGFVGDRPLAGMAAVEAQRIQAWRPRCGYETDGRAIPHELDWLRVAVHLRKGCYRGQETVARVHNLGRPPRRLFFAHLDGSGHTLPEPGAELTLDGRVVGRLSSVAMHHVDGPVGLGLVRRNTPVDAVLLAGDVTVAQTVIVQP